MKPRRPNLPKWPELTERVIVGSSAVLGVMVIVLSRMADTRKAALDNLDSCEIGRTSSPCKAIHCLEPSMDSCMNRKNIPALDLEFY